MINYLIAVVREIKNMTLQRVLTVSNCTRILHISVNSKGLRGKLGRCGYKGETKGWKMGKIGTLG